MYNLFNVGKLPKIVKEIIAFIVIMIFTFGPILYIWKRVLEEFAKIVFM